MVKSHIISQLNHENNGLFHSIQLKHTTSYQPFCSRWGLFFLFIPCASWLAGWSFPASWWVRKGPQPILLPISRGHVTISICGVSLDSKETYHLVGTEIMALSMENLENLGKIRWMLGISWEKYPSGGWWLEHEWIMTFQKQLGMMWHSQLLLTPSFFRGVGWNHQPVINGNHDLTLSPRRQTSLFQDQMVDPTFGSSSPLSKQ